MSKENVLPKVPNISHNKPELKYPRRASQQTGQTTKKEHEQGVVVIAPDGELLNVGHTLLEETNDVLNQASNNDDVVYRLFDQIPPYLYYTNKLEEGVQLSYATPHSSQHSIIITFLNILIMVLIVFFYFKTIMTMRHLLGLNL